MNNLEDTDTEILDGYLSFVMKNNRKMNCHKTQLNPPMQLSQKFEREKKHKQNRKHQKKIN